MPAPHDRIALDPAILAGKPIIRGTRIAVAHVIGLLAEGWSAEAILAQHPTLVAADIAACLGYAHQLLESARVYPSAA